MTDTLMRLLLWTTTGLVLALLLRRPARRAFGAGPAFTLWLLPVVLAFAPLLPRGFTPAAAWMLSAIEVTPHVNATAHAAVGVDWAWWLIALWLAGAMAGMVRLAVHYQRLLRGIRGTPAAWSHWLAQMASDFNSRRVRVHPAGPAVLWAPPRALILLPADFMDCFDNSATRELVLRHEFTHARRGDAWWSLAMEIASALLWFHPLVWLARSRFRLDQELACDAASLRALPESGANYARALLDSVAAHPMPALISWLTEPQLKERIAMITRIPPGTLRRRTGFLAIAAMLIGGLLVAGGQTPVRAATHRSSASTVPSVDITYKNRNPPRYPSDALRNSEQGTVVLRIHVNADGGVSKVDIDHAKTTTASAELQASAVTAAEGWKFNAGEKNGKPVGGWITIPVTFSLEGVGVCPTGQGHDLKPPFQCIPLQSAPASS